MLYMKTSVILCGVFLARRAYQTLPLRQNCPKDQSAKRGKYYQQTPQHFNNTAVCSPAVTPGTQRHHWAIGVPGYTFGSSIQARAIPPHSWGSPPRWLHALYRVSNGRVVNFFCIFMYIYIYIYIYEEFLDFFVMFFYAESLQKSATVSELPRRSKKVLFYLNFTFDDINNKQRHNVATSQRCNIDQERGKILTLGQSTFCRPGGVQIKIV